MKLAILAILALATNAYNPSSTTTASGFVPTEKLDSLSVKKFLIFLPAAGKDDGIWSLSKATFEDQSDLSQQKLVIYANQVLYDFEYPSGGPSEAQVPTSYASDGPTCEAYIGDTKCSSCTICGDYTESSTNPWSINQAVGGAVVFDCHGIIDHRTCSGTTANRNEFGKDHICARSEDNLLQGVSSCFEDQPFDTLTPTPPTSSSSGSAIESPIATVAAPTASSEKHKSSASRHSVGLILALSCVVATISGIIAVLLVVRRKKGSGAATADFATLYNKFRLERHEAEVSAPQVVCNQNHWLVVV